MITAVIPGRRKATNPESRAMNPVEIPDLRLAAHPGMTEK
jgi:hypothetical protein